MIDSRGCTAKDSPMFEVQPAARADMKSGTIYAVAGEGNWVYFGQMTPEKKLGFFRRRDRGIAAIDEILASPIMSVITVSYPSITRALRSGHWKKLGRFELAGALSDPRPEVQWPAGTLDVTVWIDGEPRWETRVDDPAIQDMEVMAVWDADEHIPVRLTADFGQETGEWHVGGPISRERKIKEERAARFPDQPWHKLLADWIPTGVR